MTLKPTRQKDVHHIELRTLFLSNFLIWTVDQQYSQMQKVVDPLSLAICWLPACLQQMMLLWVSQTNSQESDRKRCEFPISLSSLLVHPGQFPKARMRGISLSNVLSWVHHIQIWNASTTESGRDVGISPTQ